MKLVKYPNPLLKEPTIEVVDFGSELLRTAEGMLELMYRHKGIGLAGPQAGLSMKIIVMNPSGHQADEIVLVNPQIVELSGEVKCEEGCLSFPGIFAKIVRPDRLRCIASTPNGKEISIECDGLISRIIQHEVDHLDGVLLVDRMSPVERKVHLRDLRRLRKEHKG